MILPKVRDPRFVTIRRGGTLTDSDHYLLALWAASCAEHVLDLFESAQPDDPRPRQAIEHARAWVRGDVCDDRRLAGSVRGMPCCPTQVSGGGVCMAGRRASLGHGDLAARPGPPEFDRATWPRVLRLSRLEEVKDVLRARCRP